MKGKKQTAGFTLVELIVVIAILGILAGVGTVGYTGYIKKANKAADDSLIATINKAAATAVLEAKGEDMGNLPSGRLTSNAVKGKTEISVWETYKPDSAVVDSFAKYFADNGSASLKWYGSLKFEGGKFVGVESILNGSLSVPDGSDVAVAFNSSSYAALGVAGMTGMVDTLAGALAEYPKLNLVTETSAYRKTMEKLGIDPDTADEQTLANATVFYLADYVGQMDEAEVWSHIQSNDLDTWLVNDAGLGLNANDATFFNTALRYAAATSYAYSGAGGDEVKNLMLDRDPENNGEALAIINEVTQKNPGAWELYLYNDDPNENNGKTGMYDFHTFYEVMGVVNANGENFSSIEGSNLFSNAELQAEINRILGITN